MAEAKKGNGKGWGIFFTVLAIASFVVWWFFLRKTEEQTLKNGKRIYRQGGKYYIEGADIPKTMFDYYIAKDKGDSCIAPPAGNRIGINPNARMAGDTCNFWGWVGKVGECNECDLVTPKIKACSPSGTPAECVTGGSPLGSTKKNGWWGPGNICTPCTAKQLIYAES